MNSLKWLYPGMHVKRWLILLGAGIVIVSLGFGYALREVYNTYSFPDFVFYATLQFIPRYLRAALFFVAGFGLIIGSFLKLNHSVLSALMPAGSDDKLADIVYSYRFLKKGPKIVAIGGGTGLSTLLRGLKEHSTNITAIVTVADDGGSSGRLRRELGVLPPGDFRNCIAALADAEPLMTRLFQYRFSEGSGLEGHSFGNLFIVAMSSVTGNFEQAIRESSRVLAVRGQIMPSTLANVTLSAEMEDEELIHGESNIGHSHGRIKRLFLQPENAQAYPEAIRAILEADLIVMGPGSLYTSVLPNLLVRGIEKAVRASTASKVYVCNVATQRGETDNFKLSDHIEALNRHCGPGLFDYVLVNEKDDAKFPPEWKVAPVTVDRTDFDGIELVITDVVNDDNRLRHDPMKLANALMRIGFERSRAKQPVEQGEATPVGAAR